MFLPVNDRSLSSPLPPPVRSARAIRFWRALALCASAAALAACAGQGDVDRTQPDKVDKSIFVNPDGSPRIFYYRQTTTGVPPTTAFAFEGTMTQLEKVRFDITEKFLIGYRSYDYSPGSQSPDTSGTNNVDTPILVFAIFSHFDVKRDYNPGTGEQTNVIVENTTDRPWNERQYMRVDWSQNQVDPANQISATSQILAGTGASTGFSIGQGDQALINPNRPIISHDYIDFTFNQIFTPDYDACMQMFDTYDDAGPWGCGQAQITYRNSLLPVPPAQTDYVPLSYPDRQTLTDASGNPIRYAIDPTPTTDFPNGHYISCSPDKLAAAGLSGDDCTTASVDQFAKFGYFRTVRQTYDRQVGATEQGRDYFINRWNIWTGDVYRRDLQGNTIAGPDGKPTRKSVTDLVKDGNVRTITYYLNPEFPDDPDLFKMAQTVMADWSQTMRETIAAMVFADQNSGKIRDVTALTADADTLKIPDVFVLKKNDCNLDNVQSFMTANPDIKNLLASKLTSGTLDLDNLTAANLTQACSGLSAVTEDRPANDPKKFVWERDGDLRYSFIHWVDRPQPDGPLGYGPSSQDPETGEIISAAAYIYGASLDTYAQFAADSVRIANGNLDPDDLISGKTISDVLAETKSNRLAHNAQPIPNAAVNAAASKLKSLGKTQADRLVKVAAGIDDSLISRVKGTALEKLLFNDDVVPGIVPGYRPGDTPPANVFDQAMQRPWFSRQAREARKAHFQAMAAQTGCFLMADDADDSILATALELSALPPDQLEKELRVRIFRGLADHEVGHTMGLRHNFSASTDALNYDDQFWSIRAEQTPDKWDASGLSEYAYASVMDYGSRFNSDIRGLGKYDKAAIRFGYGQIVDMIPSADPSTVGDLPSYILLYDYSKLPSIVGGLDKMDTAATSVFSYKDLIDFETQQWEGVDQNGGVAVLPERPYKFCSDEFEGNFDCKTWDKGANQREIVDNVTDMYRNYYVFNAYKRGRTTWQIDSYLNRISERYFNRYGEAFQFYYFYGDSLAGYDFGTDLLAASMDALNALGAVLQTPEPGTHCTTAYSPNILVLPNATTDCNAQSKATLNLPDAKPFFINFSDDYYYRITRTGSLYEKLMALETLTETESRFFRVDTFADSNRYSINFYRVFRDEMVNLLSGVIRADPSHYGGTMQAGTYTPTPVVDPNTYGALNPPTPPYAMPNAVHVDTPVNKTIRYWTLLLALARLGSTWDATLDFQNFLAIAEKGADDDFTVGASTPVHEFTHPTSGVIYRAPANTKPNNIGADIIDELNLLVGTAGTTTGTIPLSYGDLTDTAGNISPLPNWYAAKAAVDAASAGTDQAVYSNALSIFNYVDQLVAYRVDLIGDIRLFRKQMMLLNGVIQ